MAKTAVRDALSVVERRSLSKLEAEIEEKSKAFLEVGNALAEIRDKRLYRESHKTFEAYCKSRWGYEKSYSYDLIATKEVADFVRNCGQNGALVTESQARELRKIPKEKRKEVFEAAVASAPKGDDGVPQLTAKVIREAAKPSVNGVVHGKPSKIIQNPGNTPQPEPEKPLPVVDADGELVPESLVDAFAIREQLKEVCSSLKKSEAKLIELMQLAGGDEMLQQCRTYTAGDGENLKEKFKVRPIREALTMIRLTQPSHVCPMCKGKKCDDCLKRGWVTTTWMKDHKAVTK